MFEGGILPPDFGPIRDAVRLGGMGGGEVYRITLERETVIAKRVNHDVEAYFYVNVAPDLRRLGLLTPRLLWKVVQRGETWLILETIPLKLRREE